jgi:hypothetical protein
MTRRPDTTRPGSDPAHGYLGELGRELTQVGVRGRRRARILAETADHLAEGDEAEFGDPRELAQLFADELATQASTRTAYVAFAALGLAGAGFAAGWRILILNGTADITSATFLPVGLVAAFALIACPQISFAAGLLSVLRARRLRRMRAAPAAELALLTRRTNTALAFGAASMLAFAVYGLDYHAAFSQSQVLASAIGGVLLTVPLAAVAIESHRAAAVRSGGGGDAGDMFDDLPFRLPRRPWLVCFALAGALAVILLGAAGIDEGPRNAVAESVLVIGSFAALGRRLGLRT